MSRLEAIRLFAANVASDYVHAIRDRQLLRGAIGIPTFRAAQFLGSYEGFAQHGEVPAELRRRFYYPRSMRRGESTHSEIGAPIDYTDPGPTR